MALSEAQSIYYGLQLIGLHLPGELKSDKLFVMRSCCVPLSGWTDSMWMEGARIVSTHRDIFVAAQQPDPINLALVLSRVNHCDLRDLERAAFIGPAEGCRPAVVVLDEGDHAACQFVRRGELPSAQQPSLQDRKEKFDLV